MLISSNVLPKNAGETVPANRHYLQVALLSLLRIPAFPVTDKPVSLPICVHQCCFLSNTAREEQSLCRLNLECREIMVIHWAISDHRNPVQRPFGSASPLGRQAFPPSPHYEEGGASLDSLPSDMMRVLHSACYSQLLNNNPFKFRSSAGLLYPRREILVVLLINLKSIFFLQVFLKNETCR